MSLRPIPPQGGLLPEVLSAPATAWLGAQAGLAAYFRL